MTRRARVRTAHPRATPVEKMATTVATSFGRQIAGELGRSLMRGLFGSLRR